MSLKNMDFSYATPDMQVILKLQALIDIHFKTQKQGSYYADALRENVFRLNRLVFDYLGKTVYELICDKVMEEAGKLMINDAAASLHDLAEELGFSTADGMIRYMRKKQNSYEESV